jgi:hypothetical protein
MVSAPAVGSTLSQYLDDCGGGYEGMAAAAAAAVWEGLVQGCIHCVDTDVCVAPIA